MSLFSNFFMSIAAFFGFGEPVVELTQEPVPVVHEEQTSEVDIVFVEDPSRVVGSVDDTQPPAEEDSSTVDTVSRASDPSEGEEPEEMDGTKPVPEAVVSTPNMQTMMVAGGCFWCVESDLEKLAGVTEVVSGYAGGSTDNPTYKTYGSGGHREVVEVTYDASQVSFEEVLIVTMKTTDPTDDNGTFADRGDKYSAAFYYNTPQQKQIIDDLIKEVDKFGPYDAPLAIDVEELSTFWRAEEGHQDYYKGALTKLKYQYYRNASGRNDFIEKYWGEDHSSTLAWRNQQVNNKTYMWSNYVKPSLSVLEDQLDAVAYKVTQKDGTERSGTSPLDKNWEEGIYVDILSGEPLYSSKDKFDSGTGWPSFVKPIVEGVLVEKEDRKLFSVRTETRSAIADNHIGHVFGDGPTDRGGLRYCMNGVALRFVPKDQMEAKGYADFIQYI